MSPQDFLEFLAKTKLSQVAFARMYSESLMA